jgi:ElaB/YqjD/DUF883 family membrane-anchored ribosome-binding protein
MKERAESEVVNEMAEEAAETLRGAKARVSEAYDRTSDVASQWADEALEYGRNNPLLTSLLVFGAGVGVGCLLNSQRRPRYSKRLVPAVAGAVAHAVREAIDARR